MLEIRQNMRKIHETIHRWYYNVGKKADRIQMYQQQNLNSLVERGGGGQSAM